MYTCVLFTRIWIYICRDLVHLDPLSPPSVSSRPLGSHPSTLRAVCVFVCVYTHIHPRTLPTPSINRENTDNIFIFPQSNNNVPCQQQVPCRCVGVNVLLWLLDPRGRKIRNEASSCPGFLQNSAFTMSLAHRYLKRLWPCHYDMSHSALTVSHTVFVFSFFRGWWWNPNLTMVLNGWWKPIESLRSQGTVLDLCPPIFVLFFPLGQ